MTPYTCNNSQREEGYMVPDGTIVKGPLQVQKVRYHRDTSSRACQYRRETPNDPRCAGCKK